MTKVSKLRELLRRSLWHGPGEQSLCGCRLFHYGCSKFEHILRGLCGFFHRLHIQSVNVVVRERAIVHVLKFCTKRIDVLPNIFQSWFYLIF